MAAERGRTEELFQRNVLAVSVRTDRLMLRVLLVQWLFAIVIAATLSPYAWSGSTRSVHFHLGLAVFLGALLNSLPIALILLRPGWWATRQVVAAAQMLWSGLLVHLTGGRIETHFHIFGSLAFLAFYRDWRLLPTATLVVSGDHLIRGLLLPQSVYGIVNPEWWRFLEHAGWVVFEDVVLFLGCQRAVTEMHVMAEREAVLESVNQRIEAEVVERTSELDAGREQYRALVETTNAIAWEMDVATETYVYVGPQAVRTFGYELEEWKVEGFMEAHLTPGDWPRWREMLAAARAGTQDFDLEYGIVTASGPIVNIRSAINAAAAKGGRLLFRGVMIDVTAQKELELELRQAQKLESVGRLAAGIAHEINTPVQFVNDNCHFLRDAVKDLQQFLATCHTLGDSLASGGVSPAAAATQLAEAEKLADVDYLMENLPNAIDQSIDGLERVSTIVRSMKQFAHPDQKERTETDFNDAVRSTLTIARSEYKYVAEVTTEFGEVPPLLCFAGDLNQAILNVIVNAAHAIADAATGTDALGEIAIRTWHEADHACISIRDTGGGVPAAIRDRIFDPFFTTKDVGRGTGQGLAIVRSVVVDKHGGSIDLDSEPGRGSTFTLRLPLARSGSLQAAA